MFFMFFFLNLQINVFNIYDSFIDYITALVHT